MSITIVGPWVLLILGTVLTIAAAAVAVWRKPPQGLLQLLIFGALLAIPGFLFPPMGAFGLAVAFGGYLLRRKARELTLRRQQGRGLLD